MDSAPVGHALKLKSPTKKKNQNQTNFLVRLSPEPQFDVTECNVCQGQAQGPNMRGF